VEADSVKIEIGLLETKAIFITLRENGNPEPEIGDAM
jgi:hypothetical protein